jgi:hypothetical protein
VVLKTSYGTVEVKSGAIALIVTSPTGTAVYNLHDAHKDSVSISAGMRKIAIAPGRQATMCQVSSTNFESVNQAESLTYRNLSSVRVDGGERLYTSEFSLSTAISKFTVLRNLAKSGDRESRQILSLLLKTAAIMSQLDRGPRYVPYVVLPVTASAFSALQ